MELVILLINNAIFYHTGLVNPILNAVTVVLYLGETLTIGFGCFDQILESVTGDLVLGKTLSLDFSYKLVCANCRARNCLGHDLGGK